MQTKANNGVGSLSDSLTDEVAVKVLDRTILGAELVFSRLAVLEVLQHFVLRVSILSFNITTASCDRLVEDLGFSSVGWGKFIVVVRHTKWILFGASASGRGAWGPLREQVV